MERITVHEPMKGQLDALAQLAELVDDSGTPLGHFVPATVPSASDQCPYSPAELAQMHEEQGGRPLRDIWESLRAK